jgi:hypothetical protein
MLELQSYISLPNYSSYREGVGMKSAVCSWCREHVAEQEFTEHSNDHLRSQKAMMSNYGEGSITSVSSVSYWVEKDPE